MVLTYVSFSKFMRLFFFCKFRFLEEKTTLEQHLFQNYETSVEELKSKHKAELEHERTALLNKHSKEMDEQDAKHKAQLESLSASHRDQLAAMTVELESKHDAKLVALEASLKSKQKKDLESLEAAYQESNQAKLEALEAELTQKHQEDRDELERRLLGNMDTLETTYLKEVQVRLGYVLSEQCVEVLTNCCSKAFDLSQFTDALL